MEVIETATRVLLLADGATRDYRFLRNQLQRDRHTTVGRLPAIGPAGHFAGGRPYSRRISCNEGRAVRIRLHRGPSIPIGRCSTRDRVELLEQWVAEEAGGLVVVAGPIQMAPLDRQPRALEDPRPSTPVQFQRRLTVLDDGQFGSKVPWPIGFTREGWDAQYLWLADAAEASRRLWTEFSGVFGCYATKGPKAGGSRTGDPTAIPRRACRPSRPFILPSNSMAAAASSTIGSGEMWRLRQLDPGYFEVFYTQLIRHVSQGRLMRGSSHGSLMVDQDRYTVDDTVVVRARLTTASREPLVAPQVTGHVIAPDGSSRLLKMEADAESMGIFIGQFTATEPGTYRIALPIPGVVDDPTLADASMSSPPTSRWRIRGVMKSCWRPSPTKPAHVITPASLRAIDGTENQPPLAQLLESRAEEKTLRGKPDPDFIEWLNRILLAVICGSLCVEWFLRRLMKLA